MSDTYIRLHSGRKFDFMDIKNAPILIEDIAHALANTCRYGGHCPQFYSVAQHSVLVSHRVPREYRLQALLHDASEAYLGDVVKPLKNLLPDYQEIEKKLEREIFKRFGVPATMAQCVKDADAVLLMEEQIDLWSATGCIVPQHPCIAKEGFLKRYEELKRK